MSITQSIQLEQRTCYCGCVFRCLKTSEQKYHNKACESKSNGFKWSYTKRQRFLRNPKRKENDKEDTERGIMKRLEKGKESVIELDGKILEENPKKMPLQENSTDSINYEKELNAKKNIKTETLGLTLTKQDDISLAEKSTSQSLVDESIGQLREAAKLSIASLWSQEAKLRDPQMVNAVINSAKAVTELIKLKIQVAKL